MVVGFAGDATGKTWCAWRTLPHAQSFLLIFHALKHRSSVVPPMRLRNRRAERQQNPQHGSTCGRVRRAHQAKSSDAALFFDVPGRNGPGMVVGFACDGVEKHGAHGAPYRTRNSSCCFFNPKSTAPLPCHPCGYEIGVQIGSKPPQHGSTCGRVRRAHQVKSSDAALFPDVPRRHEPEMVVLWTLPARLLHRQGIRVVPCTGTSTPRHGETTHSVAVWKRRYTSPCTFSK